MANIRRIDIALLEAFVALYDEKSVTRAAKRLALTQPTVSGMLNRLRDLFGDPLFVRTQRGILPTPRAGALAEPVKALLADAEALVTPPRFDPALSTATFSFMAHDYLRFLLVPPLASALRAAAPRARLAVMPAYVADLGQKLADGTLDLAVTVALHAPPNQHRRLLFRDPHVGAVRKGHKLKSRKLSLKEFCELDHALVTPDGGGFTAPTDRALEAKGFTRRVAASFPDYPVLMEALIASDLAAVAPKSLVRRHAGDLQVFQTPVAIPDLEVIACWHPRVHKHPAQILFRDLVCRIAADVRPDRQASNPRNKRVVKSA